MGCPLSIGRFGAFVYLTALTACFTEVGNAEDDRLLEADFRIEYVTPSKAIPKATATAMEAVILQFYLEVREAEFHLFDSVNNKRAEYHLWKDDSATLPVDFTGRDPSAVLPRQKVGSIDPLEMHLKCALPSRPTLNPDTLDFQRFSNRGYIKGFLWDGRDSTAFLFALPVAREMTLEYSKGEIDSWYAGGRYDCQFVFFANRWLAAADLAGAKEIKDVAGRRVLLLDSAHNPAAYAALTAAFYKSFNTTQVSVE
jgi:hypothetical protein